MAPQVIVVTGASSGFGAMTARLLADAGHTVYATMKKTTPEAVESVCSYAAAKNVDLRALELNVVGQSSVQTAIDTIIRECGRVDTIVHNAGHMCVGPVEAYTADQLAFYLDVNVLGAHRVNRAALPHMRRAGAGLLCWVGSTSTHGGATPFLAPYFLAKAAMDSLAVSYGAELAAWGIETAIVLPGAYTKGTNHFRDAGHVADEAVAREYSEGPYKGREDQLGQKVAEIESSDADPAEVARAIARVINMEYGTRPFRTVVDPSGDGSEAVFESLERCRQARYRQLGIEDLLAPRVAAGKPK